MKLKCSDGTTYEGKVVHVFEANEIPDPLLVKKYYGPRAHISAYMTKEKSMVVLEYAEGSYVVFPEGGSSYVTILEE
jgi:hypothetical protein